MGYLFQGQCELKDSYQVRFQFVNHVVLSMKTEPFSQPTVALLAKYSGHCSFQCLLQFHVNAPNLRWSEVFERIENLRENPQLELEDIQVSDTTLEQVFLNFAIENAQRGTVVSGVTNQAFAP